VQKKANAVNNVNNNNNNNNNGNNNNINEEEEKKKQQQQYEEERKKIEEENNITQQALNGFEKIINRQNITEEEMQIITNLMNNGNNDNRMNFIEVFKHNYPRPSNWFVNTARDRRIINLHDALDNNNNLTQQRLIDISNINSWKWVCGCSGV